MQNRRSVMAGLVAASLVPGASWAAAGAPDYVAAARTPDGHYVLCGLDSTGAERFRHPLPARGHAAAAHPSLAQAVAFARRPGRFALVLDCATGAAIHHLEAPKGRHFYGHGAFSADGTLLFTTENDYDTPRGMIGIWHTAKGYRRIGEFDSGGIGPHEIRLMPGGRLLAVANGGIETHPETGRAKLNLHDMRPNLTLLEMSGQISDQMRLPGDLQRNSIRHIAVTPSSELAFAMQWQGDISNAPPLLGMWRSGAHPRLFTAPLSLHRQMAGYAGSVAVSHDGSEVAMTSPRGGLCQIFRTSDGRFAGQVTQADVCGVAPGPGGFYLTSGSGDCLSVRETTARPLRRHGLFWDNHLVALTPV